ncbi:MAG: SUMF1/EgtB/PvdO family nonheme iron enzyme [Prevotella sp.]|nr:SUMF1/EgtB/PvdO family nonheme iron enzyme [Prevotella sp.]
MKKQLYMVMVLMACVMAFSQCGSKPSSAENAAAENSAAAEKLTFTVNGVTFNMILVKGGTFTMGATEAQGDDAQDDETPAHRVTLSDYYIGETEVTQELYVAVMGENALSNQGKGLPAVGMDYTSCDFFITRLNRFTGRQFRLPTEAEWEYAARGGCKSKGYKYAGSDDLSEVAWFDDVRSGSHPVKGKAPNELGIYDMSGNVDEYCSDEYAPYSSDAQTNPEGVSEEGNAVIRGGSFCNEAFFCRVSCRSFTPGYVFSSLGFRIAL